MMNGIEVNNWWAMGWGWIIGLIVLVLLIVLIINITKRYTQKHEKSAMDILKERYAKGEIDKNEFEEKRDAIL